MPPKTKKQEQQQKLTQQLKRQRGRPLGRGGYGAVYQSLRDPKRVLKEFYVQSSRDDAVGYQQVLNRIDPERKYLGAKIYRAGKDIIQMQRQQRTFQQFRSLPQSSQRESALMLFLHFDHILEGLVLLKSHHLAHMDIKTENIMFEPGSFRLKLIDFDLLIPFDKATPDYLRNLLQSQYYFVYPPEVYVDRSRPPFYVPIQSFLTEPMWPPAISHDLLIHHLRILTGAAPGSPQISQQHLQRILKANRGIWNDWIQPFLQTYIHRPASRLPTIDPAKIDIYSTGMLAFKYFYPFLITKGQHSLLGEASIDQELLTLLFGMIHPDPTRRQTPEGALAGWKGIKIKYLAKRLRIL